MLITYFSLICLFFLPIESNSSAQKRFFSVVWKQKISEIDEKANEILDGLLRIRRQPQQWLVVTWFFFHRPAFWKFHAPNHTESVPDKRTVFSGPPFLFGKVPKCLPLNSSSQHVLRNGNAVFPKPECCDRALSIYYIVVGYQPSCSIYKPRERTGFPFPGSCQSASRGAGKGAMVGFAPTWYFPTRDFYLELPHSYDIWFGNSLISFGGKSVLREQPCLFCFFCPFSES